MTRIALTDGSSKWFDLSSSEAFFEAADFDGNTHISTATGVQWDHQRLYRTAGGRWILNSWSQWEGSTKTYVEITDAEAAAWLVIAREDPHPACAEEFALLGMR